MKKKRKKHKDTDYGKKRLKFNSDKAKRKNWTYRELIDFLNINEKSTDIELSLKFNVTIPNIQGIRRKINILNKYSDLKFGSREYILILRKAERTLRKKYIR